MDPTTALRESPFFEGLDPDMIDRVASLAMQRQYGAHDTIFRQGEDAYALCFVLDGAVSLQTEVAGRLLELEVVGPGTLVAWSGLVEPHTFTSTAVCVKRTTVAIIRVADFEKALGPDDHASCVIHRNLAAVVSRRFHEVQERLARNLVGW
jgi:CRP/FNR family transcriptional regulator, cyclic AMP receptor protein